MKDDIWGAVLLTCAILLAAAALVTTVLAVATGEGCR